MRIHYFAFLVFAICSVNGFCQEWQANYATALAEANEQNKPLLLVFSGSDWCAPCIKLDKEIWKSEEFIANSKLNYILYRADFPRKKANKLPKDLEKQNKALADSYNPNGHFPLVVILSNKEKVLGQTGYKKVEPAAYISHLNSFLK
ncbi:thioredoxin family protein [Aurantibacter crassamenti]|uniref:thioredoxin family protein n=1 Tax=Aurantibacter crassamenti TaxID=1837375 RepID=UPI001939FD8B|nr:thioredoxin family protein [Aurantibacter crassamenti]MBM1106305.1 thioredoxin family protein [Aurantibacter crassamenti]